MLNNRQAILGTLLLAWTGAALAAAPDLTADANAGTKLTPEQAKSLEAVLIKTPDDPRLHARLLGFYQARRSASREARTAQVLWMIEHEPADSITTTAYCMIDAADNPEDYAKAKEAWDRELGSHSDSAVITGNGAGFRANADFADAQALLQKAETLEPKNGLWPERLAILEERGITRRPADAARLATDALDQRQAAYNLTPDPQHRFHVLIKMPEDAMVCENFIQAKRLARQLIGTAEKFRDDPEYGDAIHRGNIVLGEAALEAGSVDRAEEFLNAAGDTPGSATLATSGPDLQLAKRLLARGERTAVRAYLARCMKFWKDGDQRLKTWISTLDAGGMPEF